MMHCAKCVVTVEKEISRDFNQDDFQNIYRVRTRYRNWAKDMESSKRFLLQAEVEYWHEMLRLNKNRVSEPKQEEMRHCLKTAVHALNSIQVAEYRVAA